ncbi:MAG: ABC transporter permease [Caldisericum sp.]|uniref:ABC transporter permease n=1 Tax=Caldisericum sp. TaxID=2499687 RepID=UPI003D0C5B54
MKEVFQRVFIHRREENWWMNILVPITSIIIALIVGAIFIASTGRDPILAYKLMFGASGLIPGPYFKNHFAEMLLYTALFVSTGLAFALPARAGLFSIGAEGQFIVGAITAAFFGYWKPLYNLPSIIHIPIILVMVMIAGGIWGLIAGYLKAKKGINETIVTIMLNWIAFHLIEGWLVTGPMAADVATGVSGTPYVSPSARLPIILSGTRLNISILIMLFVIYLSWFLLYRTVFGYEIRAMGYTAITNMEAPKIGGINTERRIMQIMFMGGAIAALGGSFVVLGFLGQYPPVFEGGYGFDGIAVALIGGNEPVGILFSSILIGALRTGATAVQLARIPKTFPAIIEGLIVAFIALEELIRFLLTKLLIRKKEGVA